MKAYGRSGPGRMYHDVHQSIYAFCRVIKPERVRRTEEDRHHVLEG